MSPDQAMFNEANTSRTLAVDALAGRCAQLAWESAEKSNVIAQLHDRIKELESIEAKLCDQIARFNGKEK
jgi:hypothetical protein